MDTFAVVLAWVGPTSTLAVAAALHGLATYLSGWAPGGAQENQRSLVKRRLARVITFCVPVVGALLAWATRNHHAGTRSRERDQLRRFHAQFLDQEEARPERSPFTGEFERDVEVLTDAESYTAILEFGTADHKRSALRRLAELGEPQHIRLLRQCLHATDPEIRLFAYGQLESLEIDLCARLDAARADHLEAPDDAGACAAVADAHAALAACGALDEATSAWHAAEAAALRRADSTTPRGAASLDLDALDTLAGPVLRSRAETAFEARDFETVHRIAGELTRRREELPGWLEFVAHGAREDVA